MFKFLSCQRKCPSILCNISVKQIPECQNCNFDKIIQKKPQKTNFKKRKNVCLFFNQFDKRNALRKFSLSDFTLQNGTIVNFLCPQMSKRALHGGVSHIGISDLRSASFVPVCPIHSSMHEGQTIQYIKFRNLHVMFSFIRNVLPLRISFLLIKIHKYRTLGPRIWKF